MICKQVEEWKDIPNYKGRYLISNTGVIVSFAWVNKPRVMKQTDNGNGYLVVNLRVDGKSKSRMVHQLVAEAFLNHKPNGHKIVVDHIDNVKTNNNVWNLQLTSTRINSTKDRKNCVSKYTGVTRSTDNKKWKAKIWIDGKSVYLGRFSSEIEASKAYQSKLKEI